MMRTKIKNRTRRRTVQRSKTRDRDATSERQLYILMYQHRQRDHSGSEQEPNSAE